MALPAAALSAATVSGDGAAAAASWAALASPLPNSFSPASLKKLIMPMVARSCVVAAELLI